MGDNGSSAVQVVGLTKRFRLRQGWARTLRHPVNAPKVTALKSVSVEVGQGECFGLLGQNGAGKTTLFKVLATLIHPDEGSAAVLGADTVSDGARVRRHVAPVIANERSLYWRLSARENLRLFAALYALDQLDGQRRIEEVLDTVGLGTTHKMVAHYSTGMKQRLLIARALLPRPSVLLLDEPTRSLDPMSAEEFRVFLRDDIIHRHGCTVLLATHDADEVRDLCDRIAIIDGGRILTTGSTGDLMDRYGDPWYRVWTTTPDHPLLVSLRREISKESYPAQAAGKWTPVYVPVRGTEQEAAGLLDRMVQAGIPITRFEKVGLSLADLLRRVIQAHSPVHDA